MVFRTNTKGKIPLGDGPFGVAYDGASILVANAGSDTVSESTRHHLPGPDQAGHVTLPSGRKRAPYTDALLARAITQGLDSSGQQLNLLMPRWSLPESELRDLLRYLKRLGSE